MPSTVGSSCLGCGPAPSSIEPAPAPDVNTDVSMPDEKARPLPMITSARKADEMAAELKAANTPVIYTLNYPTRPRTLPPDADESLATLRARANAPKVPGALAKAGVTFAFESGGLAQPRDFVRNNYAAERRGYYQINRPNTGVSFCFRSQSRA